MTSLIATDLRAQADRRIDDAVTEAREQLAKGWQPHQVLTVMGDAADIVADLLEQAQEAQDAHDDELDRLGFGYLADLPFVAKWRGRRAS